MTKWKLVPVEPTNGMRDAGRRAAWRRIPSLFDEGDAANVYRAMLAAAPAARDQSEQNLEMARDADRLDWLLRKLPCDALRCCVGVLSDTSDEDAFREAIDAAIAAEKGGA